MRIEQHRRLKYPADVRARTIERLAATSVSGPTYGSVGGGGQIGVFEQGSFAAAAGTEQRNELTLGDPKTDIVQGGNQSTVAAGVDHPHGVGSYKIWKAQPSRTGTA